MTFQQEINENRISIMRRNYSHHELINSNKPFLVWYNKVLNIKELPLGGISLDSSFQCLV